MLNDKVNDAYGFVFATSNFLGPNIGTWLYTRWGPRTTCDIIALTNFAFALILFIFNCGPFVFQENIRFQRMIKELNEGEDKASVFTIGTKMYSVPSYGGYNPSVSKYSKHSSTQNRNSYIPKQRGHIHMVNSYREKLVFQKSIQMPEG